jgi:hypothetical protein
MRMDKEYKARRRELLPFLSQKRSPSKQTSEKKTDADQQPSLDTKSCAARKQNGKRAKRPGRHGLRQIQQEPLEMGGARGFRIWLVHR